MIDIRRLRTPAELAATQKSLSRKGVDPAEVSRAAELDARQRALVSERDGLRREINAASKAVGAAFKAGQRDEAEALKVESRRLGERETALAAAADEIGAELRDLLLRIPNLPSDEARDGAGEQDNVVLRQEGPDPASFPDHQRSPHWDIGAQLGILDLERATKISGAMFSMFRGQGATLARALCQLALDRNADAYEEIRPPTVVRTDTLVATGQLPKFADDAYQIERDDLWAIPTAEVPLTSLARDEILDEGALPMRLMAYSPCYRREAGSAGRDTRGLLRVHEFDKVEILAYTTPDQGRAMHEEILARAEGSIAALGLTYRIVDICTGDLGQSHSRQFDIEVYAPGCDMWLEVSSVSWFTDYQARRANIRYRVAESGRVELVHTLNGSALAVPRVWAAVVEANRQPDGSVAIPAPLLPYMRGQTSITAG